MFTHSLHNSNVINKRGCFGFSYCLLGLGWHRAIKSQLKQIIKPHSFIDTSTDDSRGHLMTNPVFSLSYTTNTESDQTSRVALHTDDRGVIGSSCLSPCLSLCLSVSVWSLGGFGPCVGLGPYFL